MESKCELKNRKCAACEGRTQPLTGERSSELLSQLNDHWKPAENHHTDAVL